MDIRPRNSRPLIERYPDHFRRIGNSAPSALDQIDPEDGKTAAWLPHQLAARILDIGCGWANRLVALYAMGCSDLTGVDASEAMIEGARASAPRDIRLIQADGLTFLRESEEVFDRILLFDVLEHLTADAAVEVLAACKERLTPQGLVAVQVPNLACITTTHMFFSDVTHKQGYTEFSLAQVLDAADLRSELVCPVPTFHLSRWRPWRPLSGTTLAWRANRLIHRAVYRVTNVGPRAQCYCPTLLVLGRR